MVVIAICTLTLCLPLLFNEQDTKSVTLVSGCSIEGVVCSQDQYIFIHDAILESVTCGDTQISAGDLRRQMQKLSQTAQGQKCTGFQYQFQILEQVTPNPSQVRSNVAVKNANRNRNMKYLPRKYMKVIAWLKIIFFFFSVHLQLSLVV